MESSVGRDDGTVAAEWKVVSAGMMAQSLRKATSAVVSSAKRAVGIEAEQVGPTQLYYGTAE